MQVNNKLISELSRLCKIKFDDQSSEEIKSDLNKILKFLNKLSDINTEGIEPLVYLSEEINVLRKDDKIIELSQTDSLKNAPEKDSDYFKVPTVLKK